MGYSTRHVCALFDVSSETVRNWSEEFARHLSVTANPGKGRHRNFTDEDMRVLSYIAQRKKEGTTYTEIHVELDNGNRGEPPSLPVSEAQALVTADQRNELALRIEHLQLVISRLTEERDKALKKAEEAQKYRDKTIELQTELGIVRETTEKRITELNQELETTRKRIEELNREIGEAYVRGVMDTWRQKGEPPSGPKQEQAKGD